MVGVGRGVGVGVEPGVGIVATFFCVRLDVDVRVVIPALVKGAGATAGLAVGSGRTVRPSGLFRYWVWDGIGGSSADVQKCTSWNGVADRRCSTITKKLVSGPNSSMYSSYEMVRIHQPCFDYVSLTRAALNAFTNPAGGGPISPFLPFFPNPSH